MIWRALEALVVLSIVYGVMTLAGGVLDVAQAERKRRRGF